nr:hypothetical protein [Niallia nealsonii]
MKWQELEIQNVKGRLKYGKKAIKGFTMGTGYGLTTIEINANGFAHFAIYTDASDGTIASTVSTDYSELEIDLKAGVTLHAPRIPLYEVTKEHYDNILVIWNEDEVICRYPVVEGVQYVQNPYIIPEGGNLISFFSS